jgi:hypothetical protein
MIPVPLLALTFQLARLWRTQELQISRAWKHRERTNPCEAVKPEITQARRVADNRPDNPLFSGFSVNYLDHIAIGKSPVQ